MSVLNNNACHMPVKYLRPIKKMDHIRPTYLTLTSSRLISWREQPLILVWVSWEVVLAGKELTDQ